jgi:hypothetical protein
MAEELGKELGKMNARGVDVGAGAVSWTCDGPAEIQLVARQPSVADVDWIMMCGLTGSDQGTTGFQTFLFEEMKATVDVAHRASGSRQRGLRPLGELRRRSLNSSLTRVTDRHIITEVR